MDLMFSKTKPFRNSLGLFILYSLLCILYYILLIILWLLLCLSIITMVTANFICFLFVNCCCCRCSCYCFTVLSRFVQLIYADMQICMYMGKYSKSLSTLFTFFFVCLVINWNYFGFENPFAGQSLLIHNFRNYFMPAPYIITLLIF